MAVAGGTASGGAGTADALAFARDLIAAGEPLSAVAETPVRLRVGIHRGSAVGGVIGSARLAYDYWGDTINLASRLQGVAPPGGIALSEAALAEAGGRRAAPRVIDLKGIGETRVFVIEAGA